MFAQLINKNKDSQNQSLTELHQELKSLKTLLLGRGPTASSTPSTPMSILGKPAIPAWQLASSPNNSDTPSLQPPPPVTSSIASPINGKGKENADDSPP